MKTRITTLFVLAVFAFASCGQNGKAPTPETIQTAIEEGHFKKAEHMIRKYIAHTELAPEEKMQWEWEIDRMHRIVLDFTKTPEDALEYIRTYYPDVSQEQIKAWEESRALEGMVINGEKRYYSRALRNLFRIDADCKARFEKINGPPVDVKEPLLLEHLPAIVKNTGGKKGIYARQKTHTLGYTITVPANTVPEGEMIRAWMPLPRTDVGRQSGFKLLSVSQQDYIISPDSYIHKSIYMEQPAVQDQDAIFSYSFTYKAQGEYHHFDPHKDIRPYRTEDPEYKKYTKAEAPHVVTDGRVAALAKEIVGEETNPFLQLEKIYTYISQTYPWAGAREYSTLENIPLYVLDHKHGDCGQVSLLFISMCRSLGIPARWESGWMLHPGEINLHDWAEAYLEGVGWIPIDQSFGIQNGPLPLFYSRGMDAYR
ncbi:MAG TPA: transglutaminase domain-containing protein, partial [Bacteroidales bacterium]|nr:transglutaminase domain-containing protein [Bacteroidales bacterium]